MICYFMPSHIHNVKPAHGFKKIKKTKNPMSDKAGLTL